MENNEIWFCRANKLNDPYEGCNCCYGDEFPDQNIDFFFGVKNLRDGWNEYIEKQKHNLGICSFSKHCKLMPLWAHYAGNHQGFCCEYEIIDKRDLFEVQYIACKFDVSKDINKLVQDYDDGKITDEQYNQALYEIRQEYFKSKKQEYKMEDFRVRTLKSINVLNFLSLFHFFKNSSIILTPFQLIFLYLLPNKILTVFFINCFSLNTIIGIIPIYIYIIPN